jgi:hypothetical protein
MIGTNARTANRTLVVRALSLREWLVRNPCESTARVREDEAAGIVYAAQTPDEVTGPEPRLRDSGATPARWVRLV